MSGEVAFIAFYLLIVCGVVGFLINDRRVAKRKAKERPGE